MPLTLNTQSASMARFAAQPDAGATDKISKNEAKSKAVRPAIIIDIDGANALETLSKSDVKAALKAASKAAKLALSAASDRPRDPAASANPSSLAAETKVEARSIPAAAADTAATKARPSAAPDVAAVTEGIEKRSAALLRNAARAADTAVSNTADQAEAEEGDTDLAASRAAALQQVASSRIESIVAKVSAGTQDAPRLAPVAMAGAERAGSAYRAASAASANPAPARGILSEA